MSNTGISQKFLFESNQYSDFLRQFSPTSIDLDHSIQQSCLMKFKKNDTLYKLVLNGDLDAVTHELDYESSNMLSIYSKNPIDNRRISMTNSLHTIAYLLSMQGMDQDRICSLLIPYLQLLSSLKTVNELNRLYRYAILSFTRFKKNHNEYLTLNEPTRDCIHYISNHLHEPITLSQLSAISNLSLRQINRNFHAAFQCSPGNYILSERLEASKTLLITTTQSIVDIASALSFCSESYYIKLFKNYTGISPKQFRQIHKLF
ncbi:transcriptional regulator, AraC family [Lachnospiraceae bacterium KM106-2]|nr:transcriptional regulator, AraC family [Lachnospiraceae bacterium KM106-2]